MVTVAEIEQEKDMIPLIKWFLKMIVIIWLLKMD